MRARGFTLIEVLVALMIMSVMAATAWKGMDGITRSREVAEGQLKRTLRLQAVMTQWDNDLANVEDVGVPDEGAFAFDGARVRMTRRTAGGMQVVVWQVRDGRWTRWAGAPTTQVGELETQWKRSYALQGREPGTLTALPGVEQWQVYCFRTAPGGVGARQANCQSSAAQGLSGQTATRTGNPIVPGGAGQTPGASTSTGIRQGVPTAVRLVMTLGEGSGFQGDLSRDAMVAAQFQ